MSSRLCILIFYKIQKRESNPNLISTDDLQKTEYIEDTPEDVEDDSMEQK